MQIHQLYTQSVLRNFTYLIQLDDGSAIVIDPWEDESVNQRLKERGLTLTAIINTHEHWDHTQGNEALIAKHGCQVWAHANGEGKIPGLTRMLGANEIIDLEDDVQIKVLDTPGIPLLTFASCSVRAALLKQFLPVILCLMQGLATAVMAVMQRCFIVLFQSNSIPLMTALLCTLATNI